MNRRAAVAIGLLVIAGVVLTAPATSRLDVFSSPGGEQIGTWSGPVSILAMDGDWLKVKMTGWVPKEQVPPDQLPSLEGVGFSRSNPAPIGMTVATRVTYLSEDYYFHVTVLEVIRGEEAWQLIHEANMFNDPPAEDHEYLLAKIRFEYLEGPSDTTYDVSDTDFKVISETGLEYKNPSVVEPEPVLNATLYSGASYEGWASYQVEEDDERPLLTFARDYRGRGGIWFKLYQE